MSYKGYTVREIILRDHAIAPEVAVIVDVSCGCTQCNENGPQPGHSLCGALPNNLVNDDNVVPFLDSTHGWLAAFTGDEKFVDEWLETV